MVDDLVTANDINKFNNLADVAKHEAAATEQFQKQLSDGNSLYLWNQLSDVDKEKAKRVITVAQPLSYQDPQSVINYGRPLMAEFDRFTSSVLKEVAEPTRFDELDGLMKSMLDTIDDATDIEKLYSSNNQDAGMLKKAWLKYKRSHFNAKRQFDKITNNVDKISVSLSNQLEQLKRDNDAAGEYRKQLSNFYQALNIEIAGLEYYNQLMTDRYLPEVEAGKRDGNLQIMQTYKQLSEQRIIDLRSVRQVILSQAVSLTVLQNSSVTLAAKLQSANTITLPTWKSSLVSVGYAIHQIQIAHGQQSTRSTTNKLMSKETELVSKASKDAAAVSQNSAIDMDVLQSQQQKLVDTLQSALDMNKQRKIDSASSAGQFQSYDDLLK